MCTHIYVYVCIFIERDLKSLIKTTCKSMKITNISKEKKGKEPKQVSHKRTHINGQQKYHKLF